MFVGGRDNLAGAWGPGRAAGEDRCQHFGIRIRSMNPSPPRAQAGDGIFHGVRSPIHAGVEVSCSHRRFGYTPRRFGCYALGWISSAFVSSRSRGFPCCAMVPHPSAVTSEMIVVRKGRSTLTEVGAKAPGCFGGESLGRRGACADAGNR